MEHGQTGDPKVLWSELLPFEFKRRLKKCPIVYLPLGLCEPHGQISALGLDTLKAEYLCVQTARRAGGIVAPSMGYHIHESGYHAAWLEQEVGEENPLLTSIPPFVYLHFFLYQLRAFANAGFKAIVVLTGHSGGNQEDLRLVARAFSAEFPVRIWVGSDPELVVGKYEGDHAGKFEISQLMYLRPDLIDFSKVSLQDEPGSGGRLALAADALESSREHGEQIMEACLSSLSEVVKNLQKEILKVENKVRINYESTEALWAEILHARGSWKTARPNDRQKSVSTHSQWKPYERPTM